MNIIKKKGVNMIRGLMCLFLYAFLTITCITGYTKNIIKLIDCDFDKPYKVEVIRSVGAIIPIVGVISGYCDIEDK